MEDNKCFDYLVVLLVYRNVEDLVDFFRFSKLQNSKIIVINSFYDKISESNFRKIAEDNDADFLSVPNKGYGYGNNVGINYALRHYNFNYLIVSNADIIVDKIEIDSLKKYGDAIIAPKILNLSGKNQNPSSPFTPGIFLEWMKYLCYKRCLRKMIYLIYAYSRLSKMVYYLISDIKKTVFSAHGAFVIFPYPIVKRLYPFYNEEMFLFNEEEHLGRLAKEKGISTIYAPEFVIRHKEDGSMNVASIDLFERMRQSYLVYYKYWKNRI